MQAKASEITVAVKSGVDDIREALGPPVMETNDVTALTAQANALRDTRQTDLTQASSIADLMRQGVELNQASDHVSGKVKEIRGP